MQHLRSIPTLTHALLDHLLGAILIVSPWILDFHRAVDLAIWMPMAVGTVLVISSLITRYEMGLFQWIPLEWHMRIDTTLGLILAISPWVLGFADNVILPHVVGGSVLAIMPLFSQRKPFDDSMYTEVVIREGRAEIVRYARSTDNSL